MAWQIYELTNSPLDIGLLGLARGLPQMVLILAGGVLADALDRRRLMLFCQGGECLVTVALVALTWTGQITPLALYIASAFQAVFGSLEAPARHALVPNLVPRDSLPSAIALYTAQRQVGSIAGPSLAGILLSFADPGWCYGADAVSRLVMAAALLFMRIPPTRTITGRTMSLANLAGGVQFVLGQPMLLAVLVLDFGANVFGSARALLPVYAKDILLVGPTGLGMLYAATSVGALIGGGAMSFVGHTRRAGLWVLVGQAVFGACTAVFAVSTDYWLSFLMLALSGVGDAVAAVMRGTIVQLMTPEDLRGRVSSVNTMFSNGGPQLGQFRAGAVAEVWNTEMSALTGGLITVALVAAVAPTLRKYQPDSQLR